MDRSQRSDGVRMRRAALLPSQHAYTRRFRIVKQPRGRSGSGLLEISFFFFFMRFPFFKHMYKWTCFEGVFRPKAGPFPKSTCLEGALKGTDHCQYALVLNTDVKATVHPSGSTAVVGNALRGGSVVLTMTTGCLSFASGVILHIIVSGG